MSPNGVDVEGGSFLITGGSSLVGGAIARQLLDGGAAALTLYDNLSLSSTSALEDILDDERVSFVRGDILNEDELATAMQGVDGVFALAALLTIPLGKNPPLGLRVNVDGMVSTLEAAVRANVSKVVMASSISVYGDNITGRVTEANSFGSATLSGPFALYALSKLIGEQLGRLYEQRHDVRFNAVRFSTVYGIRQHDRGVNALQMVEAYDAVRSGTAPRIVGSGADAHDFIYVDDAAAGAIAAMTEGREAQVYTIATGVSTSTEEVIRAVIEASGSDVEPVHEADTRTAAPTLSTTLDLDVTKAREELGWSARVELQDGVRLLIDWLDARVETHAS